MREYCRYRIPTDGNLVSVAIGSHPAIQAEKEEGCRISPKVENVDPECINPELGETSCPISPLCNKKRE